MCAGIALFLCGIEGFEVDESAPLALNSRQALMIIADLVREFPVGDNAHASQLAQRICPIDIAGFQPRHELLPRPRRRVRLEVLELVVVEHTHLAVAQGVGDGPRHLSSIGPITIGSPGLDAGNGTAGRQTGGRAVQVPVADRSPELARNRLSGFQGGIRLAKNQEPGTEEENGR